VGKGPARPSGGAGEAQVLLVTQIAGQRLVEAVTVNVLTSLNLAFSGDFLGIVAAHCGEFQ
jgi:hypothetical protein